MFCSAFVIRMYCPPTYFGGSLISTSRQHRILSGHSSASNKKYSEHLHQVVMTIYKISQKDYRYRTISVTTPHHIKKRLFEAINDPPSVRPFEPARNNIPGELTDLGCLEKVVRTTFISLLIYALYGHWKPYMMSNGGVLSFTAISGFFEHDNEPEGPEFRAVSRLGLNHRLGIRLTTWS